MTGDLNEVEQLQKDFWGHVQKSVAVSVEVISELRSRVAQENPEHEENGSANAMSGDIGAEHYASAAVTGSMSSTSYVRGVTSTHNSAVPELDHSNRSDEHGYVLD